MQPIVARFLDDFRPARDLRPAYRQIQRWANHGDVSLLVDLIAGLEHPAAPPFAHPWVAPALADTVERTLALTPGPAQAAATLAVAQIPRLRSVQVPRDPLRRQQRLASYLAYAQAPAVLYQLFERADAHIQSPELLAALLHELVVRGHPCAAVPALQAWATHLATEHHPLGWLPLQLTPDERTFVRYLPRWTVSGSSMAGMPAGVAFGYRAVHVEMVPRRIVDITQPTERARLAAAVAGWERESNGSIEARRFAVDPPIPPDALSPALLERLQLASLGDRGAPALSLAPTTIEAAATVLFVAASGGGAYGSGVDGAYGRLYTWQSLGALAGVPAVAPFATVVDGAAACAWWQFDAPTSWFHHVAWDVGLVALDSAGASLAVLAATDTD